MKKDLLRPKERHRAEKMEDIEEIKQSVNQK